LKKFLAISGLSLSLVALPYCQAFSNDVGSSAVTPLTANVEGSGYKELTAQWWQWASSMSDEDGAVGDTTGAKCAMEQKGNVWFLAGGYGSSKIKRQCTIPEGKSIFFPIINMVYWDESSTSARICSQLKSEVTMDEKEISHIAVEINGHVVEDAKKYHVKSDCFDLYERLSPAERPTKIAYAATDGFWILLSPLPKGKHSLKFGATYIDASDKSERMKQDIEYTLTVE